MLIDPILTYLENLQTQKVIVVQGFIGLSPSRQPAGLMTQGLGE